MTSIIGFCGRAQSGKTSSAAFIYGLELLKRGIIPSFDMSEKGELIVPVSKEDGTVAGAILDITSHDNDFIDFASESIWPYIKLYNMADLLKIAVMELFGATYEQCYGTNEQKNTPTEIRWSNMAKVLDKSVLKKLKEEDKLEAFMTARDIMQQFGTNVLRKINPDIWVNAALKKIDNEKPEIALIGDIRFENELDAVKNAGGKVIKLTLNPLNSDHESELSVDSIPLNKFDAVLDNANLNIYDKNDQLYTLLKEWNYYVKAGENS